MYMQNSKKKYRKKIYIFSVINFPIFYEKKTIITRFWRSHKFTALVYQKMTLKHVYCDDQESSSRSESFVWFQVWLYSGRIGQIEQNHSMVSLLQWQRWRQLGGKVCTMPKGKIVESKVSWCNLTFNPDVGQRSTDPAVAYTIVIDQNTILPILR